jgi:small GTP-binding protein
MGEGAFGSLKPTFEGRVVLVGLEGCGKTSLLYRMKNNKFLKRPKPTKGIDVDEWTNKVGVKRDGKKTHVKVHFSTWDFGGSSDYSAMHHLFLPERAVYLVVWDLALDEGLLCGCFSECLNTT